ncbi:MAG: uroporphyrinogen decarboxylase family protein [candidate division WOR-3 bacterium]
MSELLNPRERFGLLVIDEPQDRVPVFPLLTSYAAGFCGVSLRDYYTDGTVMAKCQLRAQDHFQTDFISVFSEVGIIAEGLGSRYYYPESELPVLAQPRWPDLEQALEEIGTAPSLPALFSRGFGRLGVYLDAINYAYEAVADRIPVLAYIPAPFTTAQQLVDPEAFLIGLIENPDAVKHLLDYATRAVIAFSRSIIRAGALPILVDPLASGSVLSPQQYAEFALPYERAVISFWHRYDLDVVLHICGDTTGIIPLIPQTGADLVSIDRIPLERALATVGHQVRLIGNFDTTTLWLATPAEIDSGVEAMVRLGKTCPRGYVCATGCEVPLATPPENLATFVRTAKIAGGYEFPPKPARRQ